MRLDWNAESLQSFLCFIYKSSVALNLFGLLSLKINQGLLVIPMHISDCFFIIAIYWRCIRIVVGEVLKLNMKGIYSILSIFYNFTIKNSYTIVTAKKTLWIRGNFSFSDRFFWIFQEAWKDKSKHKNRKKNKQFPVTEIWIFEVPWWPIICTLFLICVSPHFSPWPDPKVGNHCGR